MGISLWKSITFFLIIAIFAVMLFPSQRELGKLYTKSGIFDQARMYLQRHFHQSPEDVASTARYLQSMLYYGDGREFLTITNQMIQRYPQDKVYYELLAEFYEHNMMNKEACEVWLKLLRFNPQASELKYKAISYYKLSKDIPGLIKLYQWLITKNAANLTDYYDLAQFYSLRRQASAAQKTYLAILKKWPKEQDAQWQLACSYDASGESEKAIEWYRKTYQENPNNKNYALTLTVALLEHNKDKEAQDLLGELLVRFTGDKKFISGLLYQFETLDKSKGFLAKIEEFYAAHPQNFAFLKMLGQNYFDLNNYKKAAEVLRRYNEATGGDYHTHHLLGDILSAWGEKSASEREYREALKLIRGEGR
ncbi:MAG: tetratricopeptide repeat protein [Candidatus Omnitrophica bacterium]|nr:tetratricopeptide repeat protein [Candidatus Omnitrophota bacterium]